MSLPRPAVPDALRPSQHDVLAAWSARVIAERAQTDRCREVADDEDFYRPTAHRFRYDPDATSDPVAGVLTAMAGPGDTWLDVGAGGGRYALPIAHRALRVVAVDPSTAMLDTLRSGVAAAHFDNVVIIQGRWPPVGWDSDRRLLDPTRADVGLMAHVGYDIEDIGPFLDALEASVSRMCVAVMGEGAMTTVGRRYWAPIHGEPRVALPALPDMVTLLFARGRLPEVRLVDREPPTAGSFEALHDMARRQLWLRAGSASDRQLAGLLRHDASDVEGIWSLPDDRSRIGIATWSPTG